MGNIYGSKSHDEHNGAVFGTDGVCEEIIPRVGGATSFIRVKTDRWQRELMYFRCFNGRF